MCNLLILDKLHRNMFDGDTASSNGILSKQANEEVNKYLNSVSRYIGTNGKLMHVSTDLVNLTLFNLSRDPSVK